MFVGWPAILACVWMEAFPTGLLWTSSFHYILEICCWCVQSDLLGKSIYSLVHSEDCHEFERCLSVPESELHTSCNSPLSNRSSSFSCRVLVKSSEIRFFVLFLLTPFHLNDTSDSWCLFLFCLKMNCGLYRMLLVSCLAETHSFLCSCLHLKFFRIVDGWGFTFGPTAVYYLNPFGSGRWRRAGQR